MKNLLAKIKCYFKGHDFGPVVYVSPSVLQFCRCCGEELQGRTIEDLEPMTEDDYDHLEFTDDLYN